jgi:hypothetical protein
MPHRWGVLASATIPKSGAVCNHVLGWFDEVKKIPPLRQAQGRTTRSTSANENALMLGKLFREEYGGHGIGGNCDLNDRAGLGVEKA